MPTDTSSLKISVDSRDVKNADKSLDGLSASAKKAESSVTSSMSNMQKKVLALGAAFASLATVNKLVDDFKDIENAQIGVAKTTGASAGEMRKLIKEIEDMSTSLSGFEIEGLYDIAEAAGQLDIKGVENIEEFTRVIAMVGLTTELTAGEAATDFAKLSNSLNEPISKIEILASVANELSNTTSATVGDLLKFSQRLSGGAKTAGLMTDEIFGLSATMVDLAINFETGGTNVNKVMLDLISDSDKFASAMGANFETFARSVQDQPIQALQQLLEYMNGLSKTDAANFLENLGYSGTEVKDVLLKLSSNTELLTKNLKTANEEYKTGTSIAGEYETASEALDAQMTKVSASIKLLAADYGETLKEPILAVSEAIIDMSGSLRELGAEEAMKRVSALAIGIGGAVLALKIMNATIAINKTLTAGAALEELRYTAALTAEVAVTKILTAAKRALSLAMRAIPFVAITSGLTILASELMGASKEVEWLGDKFEEATLKAKEFTKAEASFELTKIVSKVKDLRTEYRALESERKGLGPFSDFTDEDAARMSRIALELKELSKAAKALRDIKTGTTAEADPVKKVKEETKIIEGIDEEHKKYLIELEEKYQDDLKSTIQSAQEQRLEGLDREALQTFNYYDNLMIKYAEVAGAEATLRRLQTEAIDEIIVKMKEQDEAFENTKAIDSLDAINDRYEKILDSQIAIAENGMNIDFDLDGVAKDLNNVSKAIQSMHVGSLKYTKEDIKLQNNYAKAYLAAGKDIEKQAKAESEFNADQATLKESRQNAEMAGYASLAGAMASAFEQGSKGAIAFTALQSALGIASSWTAIAQAWALPFPANIPAAAMVASQVMPIIGQLGGSSSGSGGGASAPSAKEVAIKNVEDTYTPITDRLDRQIELMESIDLKGSMGITQIALSQAEFTKASELALIELESSSLSYIDNILRDVAAEVLITGATRSTIFGTVTVESAKEMLSKTIYERIATISTTQYGFNIAEYNRLIGLAQEAINDYAISMVDTVAEMKDAGKTFEELFDSITQTSKYADLELKKAQANVANLTRGNSLESYLEKQISAINKVSESFGMNIQKLLLSTNKADLQRQAEAVDALAVASNNAFVGGVEEALNFLDSIELVGEALANSAENTSEYLDSFKTEDQLTKELAQTLGATLANSFEELDLLFKRLSLSGGLLTDTELELLSANKALIDTNAADYINDLSNSLGQLEPIANTLRSTIDNLRASSMTSEQNLANFYEAMNEATTLSTSGSYEDFATAVQKATSLSSVLNNAENFSLSRDMDFAKLVAANQFESLESITLKEIDYLRMIVENTDPLKEASTSYGFGGATSVPSIAQSVVNPNLSGAYVQNDNVNVVSALTNQNVLLNAIITKQDTQITILRESRDIQNGSLVVLENIEAVS